MKSLAAAAALLVSMTAHAQAQSSSACDFKDWTRLSQAVDGKTMEIRDSGNVLSSIRGMMLEEMGPQCEKIITAPGVSIPGNTYEKFALSSGERKFNIVIVTSMEMHSTYSVVSSATPKAIEAAVPAVKTGATRVARCSTDKVQAIVTTNVLAGDTVSVQIDGVNPSTGYTIVSAEGLKGEYKPTTSAVRPGSGGKMIFKIKADEQGQSVATYTFEYKRPWEKTAAPASTCLVKVVKK